MALDTVSEADAHSTHAIQASDWPNSYSIIHIVHGFTGIDLRILKGRSLDDAFVRTFHTVRIEELEGLELAYVWSYTDANSTNPSPYTAARTRWESLSVSKRRDILTSSSCYRKWGDLLEL